MVRIFVSRQDFHYRRQGKVKLIL